MNILDLEFDQLEDLIKDAGIEKYRAGQIFGWCAKGVTDPEDMSNVPRRVGQALSACGVSYGLPSVVRSEHSGDGTVKCLLKMADGASVEAVFMKYKYGNTICISSQAGCRMGCSFCASGMNGLDRDLTSGEMYGEVLAMENETGESISHIVVMGTGEPFDNYDELLKFIRTVTDHRGRGLSMRNITVSTCGIVPMIDRFGDDMKQVNLAISLHAVTDSERSAIMPVNRAYPIAELLDAARRYTDKTGRRITFEFTLIKDVNDDNEHAYRLAELLRGMLCHVNLIPLNEVREKQFRSALRERAEAFRDILEKRGIPATVRRELGSDIDAACGQLRYEYAEDI